MNPRDQGPGTRDEIRHLTGVRAAGTILCGLTSGLAGALLAANAAARPEGWGFLALAGTVCLAAAALLLTLPRRLTTRLDDAGVSLGWALGRRQFPWNVVRRVVIGPLGSGGERDPIAVTLLLTDGTEALFSLLGKRLLRDHPAAQRLLEAAAARGVPVDDTTATPEERKERAKKWREARLKGWR